MNRRYGAKPSSPVKLPGARTGNWFYNEGKDGEPLNEILAACKPSGATNMLGVDVSLYQNAGANRVQQLAYALAHANEYLNRSNPESIGKITFKVAVGSNRFFEIAPTRALRRLWETLAVEYQAATNCHIMALPSHRNKTLYVTM